MLRIFVYSLTLGLLLASSIGSRKDLAVTIYNNGFGIVKDTRDINFDAGESYLSVNDVAASIQP